MSWHCMRADPQCGACLPIMRAMSRLSDRCVYILGGWRYVSLHDERAIENSGEKCGDINDECG